MWIITIVLFTVYGAISGAPDICEKDSPDICLTPPTDPVDFPDSIEALDKICPFLTTRLKCLVDYKIQCGNQHPGSMDDSLDEVYELVSDACDKDSELHQELSIRLPCIERIVMSHGNSCSPIIGEAMEAIRSRILLESDASDDTEDLANWRKYQCLFESLHSACLVADASVTCGHATKELVGRVVERVGYLESVCQADVGKEVKEMVEVMQAEMEESLALKRLVSKM